MDTPSRILVIRLKSIGDVAFTLPAVNVIRDHFPSAAITFLTSRENAAILRGFRAVNEVIVLDRAVFRSGNPLRVVPEFFGLLRRLRAGKFSLVVDFQGFGETAWLARLTGAPARWGSVYGAGRSWAYTQGFNRQPNLHPADWNLHLLDQAGLKPGAIRNEFELPADVLDAARAFLAENRLASDRPLLLIQPFTSSPQKNWPLENYLAVARHWRARGVQIVFAGGPADRPALEPAAKEGFCVAAGTVLLVSAGLAKLATLMLGGDTGLGHLAVAQNRRVVMLMMRQQPGDCVPFQHPEWVVAPKHSEKINDISVETVLQATADAFNSPAGNASC
jgi:ADP-heptose:LPS heptosyltransferase